MVNHKKKKMKGGNKERNSESSSQSSVDSIWFNPEDEKFAEEMISSSRFHLWLRRFIVLIALGFTGLILFKILKK